MSDEADQALMAAIGKGSSEAFARLIDRHQQAVRAFLRRLTDDRADADDLAQETFLNVWTRAGSFRGGASVRTWLIAVAWRKARSARRAWFRGLARDGAWRDQSALQAPIGASSEDALAVKNALAGLSLEQRAAVALCLGGDFSHADAAQALGLPLGTVKSHVTRGREKLRQALGDRR
jgi:RNA polymerase sigma factor (sigma-70 family)